MVYNPTLFQRPPNYTLPDRIYPYISRAKPLNLQGISPYFVGLFSGDLKLGCFVYTYCQQPFMGSCNHFEKRSQYE
jgi:hypothetical protein